MNKPFKTIKDNVATLIQDNSSTMLTNIGVWSNNRYNDILKSYLWDELLDTYTFTATASTSAYGLDESSCEINYVYDVTNDSWLNQSSLQNVYAYRTSDIGQTSSLPDIYIPMRDVVKKQISSAQKPIVVSSSVSDTTQSVLLRGLVSGYEIYESIDLSGTTNATATNSFSKILGFSKSAATTGYTLLYENDASTLLAAMPSEVTESRYMQIAIFPTPSQANVYRVGKKRIVLPLSQNYDYPVIDCADAIEYGAAAEGFRAKRQFSKASMYEAMYEQEKSKLIFQRVNKPNEVAQMIASPLNRDEGIL
ncbi:MAG: hypothetical protein WC444_07270 [Candidatus Paceibacterota bacterium]